MKNYILLILLMTSAFYSCNNKSANPDEAEATINAEDLEKHVMALASDEFQGRKPSTIGEKRTTEYLQKVFKDMGLKGAFENNSYFQEVPIVSMNYSPSTEINLKTKKGNLKLENIKDYIATTPHIVDEVKLKDTPIVFAGYGIVAPEYGWDDYKNIDVEGKIVLVLVNDPGFATKDSTLFNGNAMTYYGRWPYKFEEAARQGATGVWVIHSTDAAGYGWNVLTNTAETNLYIQAENGNKNMCTLEGWINDRACEKLFNACGQDFNQLRENALNRNFEAIELGTNMDISIKNKLKYTSSKNVAAVLEGTVNPEECIVYTAHWDHFGIGPVDNNGDSIYNGACDNAIPLACMLETAKAFSNLKVKPKRSVVFLSITAEETGMIGSQYYAQHSPFAIDKTVANLNYELFLPMGRMKDVTITGFGQSELDNYVAEEAKKQDRYIVAEPFPENGMYYRSDHFRFAQVGVPSLFIKGWQDSREYGKEWAKEQINNYWANAYHKPGDNYYPEQSDLSGNVEDAKLFFKIGYRLANENSFPKWNENSEFKSIREN
ncbi:Zn-dependent M28 family amino/carboxypeptidase [Balneicella halophila]|uniref:Zn-dependent M28 family amino/carboxypeptidase n=1 Tax=Balneicella halophila TaxID=1537566 RepID=A0A7L4URU3_BALHA|nr:M20/M25/M40 family metallo-hydrolase [Balneicella halophila]PVX52498.1 Zn-dependent M28 family amino/carboxypeptidase [Balneicella halophila]